MKAESYYYSCSPSHIDSIAPGLHAQIIDTFNRIPEALLRGCGVPENYIRHMKLLKINPIKYYSCFISYRHHDKHFARKLYDQLQAKRIRCWFDKKQRLPKNNIYKKVDSGIKF